MGYRATRGFLAISRASPFWVVEQGDGGGVDDGCRGRNAPDGDSASLRHRVKFHTWLRVEGGWVY